MWNNFPFPHNYFKEKLTAWLGVYQYCLYKYSPQYSYYLIIWYLITFFLHVYIYRKVFNQTSEMVTNCWLHMLASRDGKWNQWADIRDTCLSWITNHSYVAKIYFTKVSLSTICKNKKNDFNLFSQLSICQLYHFWKILQSQYS